VDVSDTAALLGCGEKLASVMQYANVSRDDSIYLLTACPAKCRVSSSDGVCPKGCDRKTGWPLVRLSHTPHAPSRAIHRRSPLLNPTVSIRTKHITVPPLSHSTSSYVSLIYAVGITGVQASARVPEPAGLL
jgi:hypothetical protein